MSTYASNGVSLAFDIENVQCMVDIGTPVRFAKGMKLEEGHVIGLYRDFFLVEAKIRNKVGYYTGKYSFGWKDLALWERELQSRLVYRESHTIDVPLVFISDAEKMAMITERDLEDKKESTHSSSMTKKSAYEVNRKKTKKKRKAPERSQEYKEAVLLQKQREKEAREKGVKRSKFRRIYHTCPELAIESLKKGHVLLAADRNDDRWQVSSYCISYDYPDVWTVPKGRKEERFLFYYQPSYCLSDSYDVDVDSDDPKSLAAWRERYRQEGIVPESEAWDLYDIWNRYDSSDFLHSGSYRMDYLEGIIEGLLKYSHTCYISTDRGNVYGPLEIELTEKLLNENEETYV